MGVTVPAIVLVADLLTGCAASPGMAAEKSSLSPKRVPVVSKEELRGTCPGLTMNLTAHLERMKALGGKARTEAAGPPATLLGVLQRTFGQNGEGSESVDELTQERRRAEAINAALEEKGCKTVNLDEALRASAPAPAAKTKSR